MAKIQGLKEKLHHPIYDAFLLEKAADSFDSVMTDPRMLRFFVDVQKKTRLETNLQTAGLLPSLNTFETRAMRVVVSPPEKSEVARFLSDLIYGSVTSLVVGEKVMIEMPTFWFPAGAGVDNGAENHGQPDPLATFRFAEPVFIEPQQNFRVEMAFPQGLPSAVQAVRGPLRIWVVLDGYLSRDVQ